MIKGLVRLLRSKRGGTAVEYGMIAALIVMAMMVAVRAMASQTISTFNNISAKVAAAIS